MYKFIESILYDNRIDESKEELGVSLNIIRIRHEGRMVNNQITNQTCQL